MFALCVSAQADVFSSHEETIPKAGPHLASPNNKGSGVKASRPVLGRYDTGFYYDSTIGKVIYWHGDKMHWFDASGTQVAD